MTDTRDGIINRVDTAEKSIELVDITIETTQNVVQRVRRPDRKYRTSVPCGMIPDSVYVIGVLKREKEWKKSILRDNGCKCFKSDEHWELIDS